jgi:hypothetical protein
VASNYIKDVFLSIFPGPNLDFQPCLHILGLVFLLTMCFPFQRKVASKMARGETVKVLIVGGSVTYGADLKVGVMS